MTELEVEVVQTAKGLYRWEPEKSSGYDDRLFEEGDAIKIDPFKDILPGSTALWPIYGTFREYVTEDIAKVYIPSESNDPCPTWFDEEAGEYLIHRGYLIPQ